ncbi:cupredoxin domain-containing protein [Azospirillum sp. sgz302134]
MRRLAVPFVAGLLFALSSVPASAADGDVTIIIKDHVFQPSEVTVPANQKVTLVVDNQDPSSEEFESKSMKIEKIIGPNKQARITVGPLKPGQYDFFGEFHEKTAKGVLTAK